MNIVSRCLGVAFGLLAISGSIHADDAAEKNGEKLIAEREAAVAETVKACAAAYKTAVKIRHDAGIIDPDPEHDDIRLPEGNPALPEYLKSKQAYLKAKAAAAEAQDALLDVLPIETLRAEAAASEREMLKPFAEMTKFLQSGDVTDSNPDGGVTYLTTPNGDRKLMRQYMAHKSNYIRLKARLTKVQKALEVAKARGK